MTAVRPSASSESLPADALAAVPLFPALFAEQAARTPGAAALLYAGETVSYAALDARANRLAHRLRALGVGPEVRVGMCLPRTPELVAAILGVLKAGGTYVSLEPGYPPARIAGVLADSGAALLVSTAEVAGAIELPAGCAALALDDDAVRRAVAAERDDAPGVEIHPESLGHIIYTSGSTGRPKGVMIRHRGVAVFLAWMRKRFPVAPGERVLGSTSVAFDVHVAEVHHTLASGGTLVLVQNALSLAELPADTGLVQASMVPSAARELLQAGALPGTLRRLNLGGEPVPPDLAHALYAAGVPEVHNLYGPTEDTTYSTHSHIPAGVRRVLVGRPLDGTPAYVLDAALRPVPEGAEGDLYLAGHGLARGYLARPDMTAEKFIPDPFGAPGDRMYTTGDRARWTPEGELDCLGRSDFQVKIRGYRIELGEIESLLRTHPGVAEAVVVARGADGAKRLFGYVVGRGGDAPEGEALAALLRERLPEYMVPAAFVTLDAFPRTGSGKLDRNALPEPDLSSVDAFVAPSTPTETALAAIWSELLDVETVGVHDGFFALGGHSLLAMRAVGRIRRALGVTLPVSALFDAPTVGELAQQIDAALGGAGASAGPAPEPEAIPVADRGAPLPASPGQEGLWLTDQRQPGTAVYNVPLAWRLAGRIDIASLAKALGELRRRHEALRTTLRQAAGGVVQVIAPFDGFHLPLHDLSARADARAAAERMAEDEARAPFDLAAGPLFRASLVRVGGDEHLLLVTMHHAITDGWSVAILRAELSALYAAFARGADSPLADLGLQFADFAAWQRAREEVLERELGWWRQRLAGAPVLLQLPTDRPRPARLSFEGARESILIPSTLARGLNALAERESATLYMVLLAAYQAVLSRYAGQDDVVVGTPVAGRGRGETEGVFGFFTNTLSLRTDLSGDPTFAALLARVRETTLGAYEHQGVPFARVVDAVAPERSQAHTPVFQAMLVLQNTPAGELDFPGVQVSRLASSSAAARADLLMEFVERTDGLVAEAEYATDLFEAATVRRFLHHLTRVLEQAADDASRRLSALELMAPAEAEHVDSLSVTPPPPADARLFPVRFAEQAARTPDAVALVSGAETVTYAEVDARANRLANRLAALGVGPDVRVGILLPRTPELVVAVLAVLKAGGAYVPLDPRLPADRVAQVLRDSEARLLLARDADRSIEIPRECGMLCIDTDAAAIAAESAAAPRIDIHPENLSHVIYTSGSTGRPKGVMIRHGAVASFLSALQSALPVAPGERVLGSTSTSFDVHVAEVHLALSVGATLVLVENALSLAGADFAPIAQASMVPSAAAELLRAGALPGGVRRLNLGGEAVPPELARALYAAGIVEVHNFYGPTEDTTYSMHAPLAADVERMHVGRPMAGRTARVLDAALRPAPVGVPGDVYMSGPGLARGYLGQPGMTAERFVPDPATDGGRMYRTGDRARWVEGSAEVRADVGPADADSRTHALTHSRTAVLEYLGRTDFQVKIRGFRVEPGEVEAALRAHAAVRDAVVVARDAALVAYVVAPPGADADPAALRDALGERLPAYMVPSAIVVLDALPLNANGKVDRGALPAHELGAADDYEAPRTAAEEVLAGIWAELLGAGRIGAHDDFFALGGHSLLAMRLVSRIREAFGVELPLAALFAAPTVAGVAAAVAARRGAGETAADLIVPVDRDGALPLSFAQERLWFLEQMEPGASTYVVPAAWRLSGALDVPALERGLGEVMRRHEALRTVFRAGAGGRPVQVIHPPAPFTLPVQDLSGDADAEAEAMRRAHDEAVRPFRLDTGPLFRARLLRIAPGEHLLLASTHHAVSDAWSMGVLQRELSALYETYKNGEECVLPPLDVQYADFAVWQRERMSGARMEAELAWWTERLRGAPATLELPADRPRPATRSHRGAVASARLPRALRESLEALARREGATLYMVMLAAFQLLLARHAGQDDLVVGTPIAGRTRGETEGLIGFFVNTLALRADLRGDPTFRELLARVRETMLGAYEHQELPFERLVEALAPERSLSRAPVFQVLFALQNAGGDPLALPGLDVRSVTPGLVTSKLDLSLHAWAVDDGSLEVAGVYATDLFDAATVDTLLGHFGSLLASLAADPAQRVSAVRFDGDEDRARIAAWNATAAEYDQDACIHPLFEAAARRTPDAVALECGGRTMTYAALDARANAIARRLRARRVGPGTRVGVLLEPSFDMIAALLGVLKAGAAYVPLDPAHPRERVAWTVADASVRALLTTTEVAARLGMSGPLVVALDQADAGDDDHRASVDAGHPRGAAYLLYTSGSTGTPKGVVVEHRGVVNLVTAQVRTFGAGPGERILQFAPLGFDASVAEIFIALCSGATLCLAERDALLPGAGLVELMREMRITCAKLTPSALAALPEADLPLLRTLIVGGEACPPALVHRWAPGRRFFNVYGPTEATVRATTGPLSADRPLVDIGAPLANVRAYVLDAAGQPVPVGVPGELYVGGVGVARGYWRRPALTAERFLPDPFSDDAGGRMYRTGDRSRWKESAEAGGTESTHALPHSRTHALEFLGRLDAQLKVRGVRIEPGEVEAALLACPGVREAAVAAREDEPGDVRLVGYVVPADGATVDAAALRTALRARLPDYLVPTAFVALDALPVGASGKVDRRALPAPEFASAEAAFAAPATPTEEMVAEVLAQVLGTARIGRDDDFFEMGGHSLLAVRVLARIRERLGIKLTLRTLFEHPTVAGLAAAADAKAKAAGPAVAVAAAAFEEGEL